MTLFFIYLFIFVSTCFVLITYYLLLRQLSGGIARVLQTYDDRSFLNTDFIKDAVIYYW